MRHLIVTRIYVSRVVKLVVGYVLQIAGGPLAEAAEESCSFQGTMAKAEVGALVDRLGFFGIDLGCRSPRSPCSVSGWAFASSQPRPIHLRR
jgi:hypothetical protein